MAGIRVSSGEKRIEVNDNGDYIVLNFGDSSFPDRFFDMVDRIQEHTKQAESEAESLKAEHEPDSDGLARAVSSLYRKLHEGIMSEIDLFFGQGTCKKVFGDIVPDILLFDDFFNQLQPYFVEFSQERSKRLSKYSAARTGNV